VEFDGRGDYVDYYQHRAAYTKVRKLAEEQPLFLVFYCHGWRNNSQSGDVVEFNSFLRNLAAAQRSYRVHGVYLSWRGNPVRPFVDKKVREHDESAYKRTEKDFGAPIVDAGYHRYFRWTGVVPELASYWLRKGAAEDQVPSVAMARTVLWCSTAAKVWQPKSIVWVMGHSMGALMLERALLPTSLSALAGDLSWFKHGRVEESPDKGTRGDDSKAAHVRMPYDLLMFVNSAAPAIYAKQARDFLGSIQKAYRADRRTGANAPLVISITSAADSATGFWHPVANCLARLYPSLRRTYLRTDLGLEEVGRLVHQSALYKRTPGHHPLLVNHWITPLPHRPGPREELPELGEQGQIFDYLLNLGESRGPFTFPTLRQPLMDEQWWQLESHPPGEGQVREYRGGPIKVLRSKYWTVRLTGEATGLIPNHYDMWNTAAMDLYIALFRKAQIEREKRARRHR